MCAIIKNPLQRDGTSQKDRLLKALLPENAKIDDRKIEDMLSFAVEYSRLINFYNSDNIAEGDWSCFYENDPCIQLALLATIDTNNIEAGFKILEEKINAWLIKMECTPPDECEADALPGYYDEIINLTYSVALRIQQACKRLPDGHLLKEEIIAIIKNDLHLAVIDNRQQDALVKLIGFDKGSIAPLNDYGPFIQTKKNNFCICTKAWQLNQEGYDCIYPDNSFGLAALKTLFYLFFIALLKIKQKGKNYFEECIEKNDSHQAHVTLFLTFLYLFQYAIDHLNTLTRSHLMYYYEKVLCLHKLKEVPDKVHVIFELAKNFHTHLIAEGTSLNGGKNGTGRQIVYALMEEVVVNRAKVAEIKTVYIDEATGVVHAAIKADSKDGIDEPFNKDEQAKWKALGSISNPNNEVGFALASPMFRLNEGERSVILNISLDGKIDFGSLKQPLALYYSSANEWIEFTDVKRVLLLKESDDKFINEYIDFFGKILEDLPKGKTEEQPEISKETIEIFRKIKELNIDKYFIYRTNGNELDILFFAKPSAKPFTIPVVVDAAFIPAKWPVVKVLFKNAENANGEAGSSYADNKNFSVQKIAIKQFVSGVKKLTLQNDNAILDASKDYQPFGERPYPGSAFYIGSSEAFQKKLDYLQLNFEWAGLPIKNNELDFRSHYTNYPGLPDSFGNSYFTVKAEYLEGSAFQNIAAETNELFNSRGYIKFLAQDTPIIGNPVNLPKPNAALKKDAITSTTDNHIARFNRDPSLAGQAFYDVGTQRGFLRLNMEKDFFHSLYPMAYTAVVATKKDKLSASDLPQEPYTPKLKNLSLSYLSTEEIIIGKNGSNNSIEQFYHITPFGYQLMEIEKEDIVFLLPQFTNAAEPLFTQGNLYIGLKDAEKEQKINILFQVLDGTGDNRFAPPDVEWSYLVNNEWLAFKPFEIQDHTRADESSRKSLLKSGIIEFNLPKAITDETTTILNSTLNWIRAVAHEDLLTTSDSDSMLGLQRIAALPDLVAILAQAGIGQFENHNNSLTHLAIPLHAKTIAKFIDSRAEVKKLEQPFYSFDGRLTENDNQFYTRVSERLRHKNRAICIWDYERLVLEAFPQLHKVKCINHTGVAENLLQPNVFKLREITPGFVTISVIPDLRNKNAVNALEPRVPIGMLDDIKIFLKKHTNLFVASAYTDKLDYLQVLNPLYEPIKVKTCIRFYEGLDVAYYKYVLNEDLKKFLSPWSYDANTEINFGSAYHKSAILNFIEERKYVDVVLGFEVVHYKDGTAQPRYDPDWIIPTTSRSILTSYNTIDAGQAYEHDIEYIPYNESDPCPDCGISITKDIKKEPVG